MGIEDLKDLEIVFTKSKKKMPIGSWGIRWFTSLLQNGWRGFFKLSDYSHVARATEIRDWGRRFFQASEGKVNYEHETHFLKKHIIVREYCLLIPKDVERKIKEACYRESGNSYATMQNLGIAATDIALKVAHKNIKNPWTKGKNCSEITYSECLKILIPELDYDPQKIKPHQIEEIILKHFKQLDDGRWILKSYDAAML